MDINNGFWTTPFGITILSLGSLIILGLLSWAGRIMFRYFRSRIILRQKPKVEIILIRRTVGRDKPYPILRINLKGLDIFTRQLDGYYWSECKLFINRQSILKFRNERMRYQSFMDLGDSFSFEIELPDWSFWENKEKLKRATFTSYLLINDRKCRLTKHQIPTTIETWQQ